MYFPIIRGRQYDLLALRDLKRANRLSQHVIPVIEPVKISSTLHSTVQEFEKDNSKLIIITNPKVGSIAGELGIPSIYQQYKSLMEMDSVIIGHHLVKDSPSLIKSIIQDFGVSLSDLAIIHAERNLLPIYNQIFSEESPYRNIAQTGNTFKRQLNSAKLVNLEDKFNKLPRNADYLDNIIEFYSEDHLYYKSDGYTGFGDYSVVGQDYSEGGFAPYAVAIHIVYFNDDNALEIYHFVSDSNEDISDPAGKFFQAIKKLYEWHSTYSKPNPKINTLAMSIFLQHYHNGTYPGLPTIKKLSIMHHLELIGSIFDEVEQ